jgi:hypothetical protein
MQRRDAIINALENAPSLIVPLVREMPALNSSLITYHLSLITHHL